MRAAMRQVERIMEHGVTAADLAQAHADLQALNAKRQLLLPLKLR